MSDVAPVHVLHLASGDIWAGAEAQISQMLRALSRLPGLALQAVLLNDGRLARELRQIPIPVTVFDEHHLTFPGLLRCLMRLVQTQRVDVIHAHRYKENTLAALVALSLGFPQLVSTVHGLPEPITNRTPWRHRVCHWLNRRALRWGATHLIAVSSEIAREMERVAPGRVSVVHNSVRLDHPQAATDCASLRRSLRIPPQDRVVGAIGRLVPVKGMDLFLECAGELLRARKDLSFLIVGDGPERARLEQLVRSANLTGKVVFAGYQEDIHSFLSLVDVLVIPSRHEGIPTVLLEALAHGTPVVATQVGGIPEVVQDRVNGLLVPSAAPSVWSGAILSLLDDPEIAARLGARGQAQVAERWTIDRQGSQLWAIYHHLPRASRK